MSDQSPTTRLKNRDKPVAERDRRYWKRYLRKRMDRIRRGEIPMGRFVSEPEVAK